MRRKYRDDRNSRRNRRWLQEEMEADGPVPISYDRFAARQFFAAGFIAQSFIAGGTRRTGPLIPFKDLADRRPSASY